MGSFPSPCRVNGYGSQLLEQVVAVLGIYGLAAHSAGVQELLEQGAVLAGLADAGVATLFKYSLGLGSSKCL